jgi:hypothetical protein
VIGERLIDTPSDYLSNALTETEQNLKAQKTQKAELEKSLESAKSRHRDLLSHDVVYSQLVELKDIDSRAKLREEIRRKVSKIEIYFGSKRGTFVGFVTFINGVKRQIIFGNEGIYLAELDATNLIQMGASVLDKLKAAYVRTRTGS